MPRQQNFFYQSPLPSITQSLGKALFGDPAAHDAQVKAQSEAALRAAQTGEATAHGGLYTSQTTGQDYQNTSAARQPADLEAWARSQFPSASPLASTIASTSADRLAPLPEAVAPTAPSASSAAPSEDPHVAGAVALSRVIASMTGAQGDKVDPQKTMSTLAAFLGGPNADTLGRGALIAGGHTPGKEFATDSTRADVIRDDEQAAGLAQAMGVARVNHANDRYNTNVTSSDRRYSADSQAGSSRYSADAKANGATPTFDAIRAVFPDAVESSGPRDAQHNADVGGVPNSYHVPGNHPGAMAFDIPARPGMTVQEAAREIEAKNPGVRVVEARDETGRVGPNGQPLGGWHFALQGTGKPGKAAAAEKPPRGISAASDAMLKTELKDQAAAGGYNLVGNSEAVIRARSGFYYKRDGNGPDAVRRALADGVADSRGGGSGADGDLRAQANDAIGRGADPAAVAKRFRELNGVEFGSTGNTFTMADAQHTAERHNVPIAQVLQNMKAAGQRLAPN